VIDKFNYLKGLAKGPAASEIQGLTLSKTNYTAVLELLEERFGRNKTSLNTHGKA